MGAIAMMKTACGAALALLFCLAFVNTETHLHPPEKPHLETVEETAAKAQALAATAGNVHDKVAQAEQALMVSGFMPAFIGAIAALAAMTVISAAMGYAAPALLPKSLTHYAGVALFAYFGQQLLREGMGAEHGVSDELEETEEELAEEGSKGQDLEGGGETVEVKVKPSAMENLLGPIFVKTFMLTFLAEWGDRSQIAPIALAAVKDPYGVTVGGVLGHSLCTAMAVIGGRMLASRISEKTMLLLGGVVFLIFAVLDLIKGPE